MSIDKFLILAIILLSLARLNLSQLSGVESEQKLISNLMNDYNKYIKPNMLVVGDVLLFIRQIVSLDEKIK